MDFTRNFLSNLLRFLTNKIFATGILFFRLFFVQLRTKKIFSLLFQSNPMMMLDKVSSKNKWILFFSLSPNLRFISFKILNEMTEHGSHINCVMDKITVFYIENGLESNDMIE